MNYEQKYLKYKNKYFKLKTMIGGFHYSVNDIVTNKTNNKVGKIIEIIDNNIEGNIWNEQKCVYTIQYDDNTTESNVKYENLLPGDIIN